MTTLEVHVEGQHTPYFPPDMNIRDKMEHSRTTLMASLGKIIIKRTRMGVVISTHLRVLLEVLNNKTIHKQWG